MCANEFRGSLRRGAMLAASAAALASRSPLISRSFCDQPPRGLAPCIDWRSGASGVADIDRPSLQCGDVATGRDQSLHPFLIDERPSTLFGSVQRK
jgi:hypothetical protein